MTTDQPRLFEFRMGERAPGTLVVAEANRDAARLLQHWRAWPGGALALVGPGGSGKTHLALAWAVETGARELSPQADPEDAALVFAESGGRVLIDDADAAIHEGVLWRLIDLARAQSGALLLVGKSNPKNWAAISPDMRSRLAALPVASLGEPDEALLEVVLRRICRELFMELSEDASRYLVQRMPRTFAAARSVAGALDGEVAKGRKPVSLAAAKRALAQAEIGWSGE